LIEQDAFLVPKNNDICQLRYTPEICTRVSQLLTPIKQTSVQACICCWKEVTWTRIKNKM